MGVPPGASRAATPKSAAPEERLIAATEAAMRHMTIWQGQEVYEAATLDDFYDVVTPALVAGMWRLIKRYDTPLVAAAPDLLEALRRTRSELAELEALGGRRPITNRCIEQMGAAIAKATGGSGPSSAPHGNSGRGK